jgi:hypothetical protein
MTTIIIHVKRDLTAAQQSAIAARLGAMADRLADAVAIDDKRRKRYQRGRVIRLLRRIFSLGYWT